jgi:hypothetical protein
LLSQGLRPAAILGNQGEFGYRDWVKIILGVLRDLPDTEAEITLL